MLEPIRSQQEVTMTAHTILTAVGTLLSGLIANANDPIPSADPAALLPLLADLGVTVGAGAAGLETAIRHFQQHVGLPVDGVAGPRTVHELARYAGEARDLRYLYELAA
jgi:peptidoglycan hydrolase-like protein with peptidoglycan-binding domain